MTQPPLQHRCIVELEHEDAWRRPEFDVRCLVTQETVTAYGHSSDGAARRWACLQLSQHCVDKQGRSGIWHFVGRNDVD
jgi:hypothetical protein